MTGPRNYGLSPSLRRKRGTYKVSDTKFIRKYGKSGVEIADLLGVSYGTAWKLMQDPVKREAIIKDLGLTNN